MDKKIARKYTNGEVTVIWKPDICIHSAICFSGLPEVFDPRSRPWVNPENATSTQIIDQVKKCPSGALTYLLNEQPSAPAELPPETVIEVTQDGPLLVHGTVTIKDASGKKTVKEKVTALCRCGGSLNKPYCDGTHRKNSFKS